MLIYGNIDNFLRLFSAFLIQVLLSVTVTVQIFTSVYNIFTIELFAKIPHASMWLWISGHPTIGICLLMSLSKHPLISLDVLLKAQFLNCIWSNSYFLFLKLLNLGDGNNNFISVNWICYIKISLSYKVKITVWNGYRSVN